MLKQHMWGKKLIRRFKHKCHLFTRRNVTMKSCIHFINGGIWSLFKLQTKKAKHHFLCIVTHILKCCKILKGKENQRRGWGVCGLKDIVTN